MQFDATTEHFSRGFSVIYFHSRGGAWIGGPSALRDGCCMTRHFLLLQSRGILIACCPFFPRDFAWRRLKAAGKCLTGRFRYRVPPLPGKVWNLTSRFSRSGKTRAWKNIYISSQFILCVFPTLLSFIICVLLPFLVSFLCPTFFLVSYKIF